MNGLLEGRTSIGTTAPGSRIPKPKSSAECRFLMDQHLRGPRSCYQPFPDRIEVRLSPTDCDRRTCRTGIEQTRALHVLVLQPRLWT